MSDFNTHGFKDDSSKPDLHLVLGGFAKSLNEVGKVGTFGANKYTKYGWKFVPKGKKRYSSAMLRHYFQDTEGTLIDDDSNLLHAAHCAWNALARLEIILHELEVNDLRNEK